jgi:DNA repair protein RecN (Recombination protein N)
VKNSHGRVDMLKELYIKNYALIDELTIQFSKNLTVLSGETGAGKSIIVGAMGIILGEKARTSNIRAGKDSCAVEARLDVGIQHPVYKKLKNRGIEYEEGEDIVIRRIVSSSGTSKSFVNGCQVSVRDIQEITSVLIDIHGQHDHQSLLDVKNHLYLLDRYGKLQKDLEGYRQSYKRIADLQKEIAKHRIDEREKERRIDILKYSIQEIDRAQLKDGEEQELESELKILKNYEVVASSVSNIYNFLKCNDTSALSQIENALSEVRRAGGFSAEIRACESELESTKVVIEEMAINLKSFIDGIEYEPGKLDGVVARLELIKNLKKKYGATLEEIRKYRDESERDLESLELNEEVIGGLERQLADEFQKAAQHALSLSAQRRVAGHALEESVKQELFFLNMAKSRFKVNIVYKEKENGPVIIDRRCYELNPNGIDQVEFLITTNVGEPLRPLKTVASGGELSRIMLAIKTILGNVDPIQTFVFDEIDAGIGGKVAWALGNRLKNLARIKQILCITHQAQIASKADLNIRVEKIGKEERTVTEAKFLNGEEKVEEIARMISGKRISDTAMKQAVEMIEEK